MSYPKKVKLFKPWAEAMVAGATVDTPDYGKKASRTTSGAKVNRKRRRRRKRKMRTNAQET